MRRSRSEPPVRRRLGGGAPAAFEPVARRKSSGTQHLRAGFSTWILPFRLTAQAAHRPAHRPAAVTPRPVLAQRLLLLLLTMVALASSPSHGYRVCHGFVLPLAPGQPGAALARRGLRTPGCNTGPAQARLGRRPRHRQQAAAPARRKPRRGHRGLGSGVRPVLLRHRRGGSALGTCGRQASSKVNRRCIRRGLTGRAADGAQCQRETPPLIAWPAGCAANGCSWSNRFGDGQLTCNGRGFPSWWRLTRPNRWMTSACHQAIGLLTVSDARGRILAERSSSDSAGVLLAQTAPVGPGGTFYGRTGDWFAWGSTRPD
jgi:hypothetical protein